MSKLRIATLALALSATGAVATADPDYSALRADEHVHQRLLGASIAYLIDEECQTIARRTFYALTQALKLRSYARDLGYTNKEIAAYVDSKAEQDRFRAIAEPYLADQGAVTGDSESYCAVGRAEIEKRTIAGSLLRVR